MHLSIFVTILQKLAGTKYFCLFFFSKLVFKSNKLQRFKLSLLYAPISFVQYSESKPGIEKLVI